MPKAKTEKKTVKATVSSEENEQENTQDVEIVATKNSEVPTTINFSPSQVDLIKRTIAKDATDDELKLFLYQAKRTGLDPLARQIHFVKRSGAMTIQTSIDGFRIVAERSGKYAGQDEPKHIYAKVPLKTTAGNLIPSKTIVNVYKFSPEGTRYLAASGEAFWAEFKPKGNQAFMWEKMPHIMLAKCAEAQALRKAFPQDLSGIYADEEMEQAKVIDQPPKVELITEAQRKTYFSLADQMGYDPDHAKEVAKKYFKADSFNDLTKAQAAGLIAYLDKKLKEKAELEAQEANQDLPEFTSDQIAEDVFNAIG